MKVASVTVDFNRTATSTASSIRRQCHTCLRKISDSKGFKVSILALFLTDFWTVNVGLLLPRLYFAAALHLASAFEYHNTVECYPIVGWSDGSAVTQYRNKTGRSLSLCVKTTRDLCHSWTL
jgi:hypothetical protein